MVEELINHLNFEVLEELDLLYEKDLRVLTKDYPPDIKLFKMRKTLEKLIKKIYQKKVDPELKPHPPVKPKYQNHRCSLAEMIRILSPIPG